MPRLFVAVELNQEALDRAARIEERLRRALRRKVRVRWTRPGGRHVTLAFLGPQGDEHVERVDRLLTEAVKGHGPFEVRVGGLGAFPNSRRSRVLWQAVGDEQGRLLALAESVLQALQDQGYEIDRREFKGHLTLGRVADRSGVDLGEIMDMDDAEPLRVRIDAVVLFESQLAPSGARYHRLRQIRLDAGLGHDRTPGLDG